MGRFAIVATTTTIAVAVTTITTACLDTSNLTGREDGVVDAGDDGVAPPNDASTTNDDGRADVTTGDLPGRHLFSRSFGGDAEDYLSHGAVDISGNLLLAGTTGGAINFGSDPSTVLTSAGANDMLFAKLDPKGTHVFSSRYGDGAGQNGVNITGSGTGDIYATGVYVGSFLVGTTQVTAVDTAFDTLVLRFNGDGRLAETAIIAGDGLQIANGLAFDGSRGVFLSGASSGPITVPQSLAPGGGNDLVSGHVMSTQNWAHVYGDASEQFGRRLAYDPSGSVVTVGYFGGTMTVDTTSPAKSVTSKGGFDAFVLKQTVAGEASWITSFGDLNDQKADAVAIDGAGNIFIAGTFSATFMLGATMLTSAGATDIFIAKLDKDGKPLWAKGFGGVGADSASELAFDSIGNILIVGSTFGPIDFGGGVLPSAGDADAYVVKLDASGNHIWSKRFGDAGFQSVTGVGATPNNEVWVAGYFTGEIDLGGGALKSAGLHDIFVARFAP